MLSSRGEFCWATTYIRPKPSVALLLELLMNVSSASSHPCLGKKGDSELYVNIQTTDTKTKKNAMAFTGRARCGVLSNNILPFDFFVPSWPQENDDVNGSCAPLILAAKSFNDRRKKNDQHPEGAKAINRAQCRDFTIQY